ncbi:MAG: hypothetical protein LPK46_06450, partial [Bacteroidota bacterium]|nr:hypothetical protein [Bacteroidota bacterium]MDX5505759.1 hypothetical protein [Bacteroidota bacterium]
MKRGLPMMLLLWGLSIGAYAQLTAPFTQSFNATSIPTGWSSFNDCSSTSTNAFFKYGGTLGYDASICTDNTGQTGSTYAWVDGSSPYPCRVTLQTDSIDVSNLTGVYLEFFLFSYNSNYVAQGFNTVVINYYDGAAWNDSVLVYSGSDPAWQYKGVDLSAFTVSGKVMFQFVVDKNAATPFYNDIAFDDIAVKNPPTCPFPNGFMVNSVDTTGATLSWGAVGSAGSYKVIYGPLGFNPATSGSIDSTTVDSITLSGLTPSTNYHAYLYADCGSGDYSDTVGPISFATLCYPVLGGTYTINSNIPTGGTNFANFSDFSYAVTCGGITGPVVVNVAPFSGPYQEQAYFGAIPGISSTNTITINGNGETIEYDGTGDRYTMAFDGASYINVNNLVIEATGTSQGWGIWITGGSEYITIDSCTVSVNQGSTSSAFTALAVSSSSTSSTTSGLGGQNLTVTNSTFEGGYYCVTFPGPSTGTPAVNNVFENNIVRDFVYYGIYMSYQQNGLFKGNDISRPNRQTAFSFYGIYGFGTFYGTEVTGNALHNVFDQNPTYTGTVYAIYFSSAVGGGGQGPFVISNNLIYNVNMDGTQYGMYFPGTSDSMLVYHNTVSLDNTNATGSSTIRGIYFTSSSSTTDVEIMNNIVHIAEGGTGTKHGIYLSSTTPNYTSNYNQYSIVSTSGANYAAYMAGGNRTTIADIQNNSTFEANGTQGDPLFVNPASGDLTPTANVGNNNAAPVSAIVPVDFYGVTRPANSADRGAIEFSPLFCLQPYNIIYDTVTTSSVYLQWTNDAAADSVKIEWVPCGGTQGTGGVAYVADSSFTVTGLMDNQCYDFYFTSYCSGTIGNGTALLAGITTKCLPVSMPYVEPFTTWVPSCVELSSGGGGSWTWQQYTNSTGEYAEAPFWSYSTGTSTMRMAVVDISTRAWVRFKWAHRYQTFYPDDRILLRAAIVGTNQWDTLVDLSGQTFDSPNANNTTPPTDPNDFIEEQIVLDTTFTGEDVEFEMIALTDFGPDVFIDEFVVEQVPSCLPPFDIQLASLGADSATIKWQTVSGTNFNLEWGPCGFLQGSGVGTVVNNVTSPYTINNLAPNTCYDVYVNDPCNSSWTGPFSFKTDCLAQLNGLYTVGGPAGPTNFATLDSALAELNGCGISGPVIFDLAPGTYNTSINLLPIQGSSATNTVTFRGASAAQDTVNGNGQPAAAQLVGAKNIIFKNLTLANLSSGWGIWLTAGASNITVDSCVIAVNPSTTSSLDNAIVASNVNTSAFGYDLNAYNFTISNSTVSGGYYGMRINGQNTSNRIHGFTVDNVEFVDVYGYPM